MVSAEFELAATVLPTSDIRFFTSPLVPACQYAVLLRFLFSQLAVVGHRGSGAARIDAQSVQWYIVRLHHRRAAGKHCPNPSLHTVIPVDLLQAVR